MIEPAIRHDFNLIPIEWRSRSEVRIVAISLAVTLAILLSALGWLSVLKGLEQEKLHPRASSALLTLQSQEKRLTEFLVRVQSALTERPIWSDDLIAIASAAAGRIWLEELLLDQKDQKLKIVGMAHDTHLVSSFMADLAGTSFMGDLEVEIQPQETRLVSFTLTGKVSR